MTPDGVMSKVRKWLVESVTDARFFRIYSMNNKGIPEEQSSSLRIAANLEDKDELLDLIIKEGIISESEALKADDMRKRDYIKKHHKYAINHCEGRWFTYLPKKNGSGRKRFARTREEDLIDYLYRFYRDMYEPYSEKTVPDLYDEWLKYKFVQTNRMNTVHRIDTDYRRYYVNEPLSQKIMTTPLTKLTRFDIKEWGYSLVDKYDLTRRSFGNITVILKQMYDMLVDKEIISFNPFSGIRFDSRRFRSVVKKPADTQIFYADELEDIIEMSWTLAHETNDETFLGIPILIYSGIRIGEMLALNYEDFDRGRGSVMISKSFCVDDTYEDGKWGTRRYVVSDHLKKNAEAREVAIPDKCFCVVDEIRKMQAVKEGAMPRGQMFIVRTPAVVSHKLYRICDRLHIRRRSPHKLRKTYISTLLNHGADPDFVREQAGHRELQTTFNSYTYSTQRFSEKRRFIESIL